MGGIVTTETQACDISLWCIIDQTAVSTCQINSEIMEVIEDWTIIHVGPDKKEMAVKRELELDHQYETFNTPTPTSSSQKLCTWLCEPATLETCTVARQGRELRTGR